MVLERSIGTALERLSSNDLVLYMRCRFCCSWCFSWCCWCDLSSESECGSDCCTRSSSSPLSLSAKYSSLLSPSLSSSSSSSSSSISVIGFLSETLLLLFFSIEPVESLLLICCRIRRALGKCFMRYFFDAFFR